MKNSTSNIGCKIVSLSTISVALLSAFAANAATEKSEFSSLIDNGKLTVVHMTQGYGERLSDKAGYKHDIGTGFKVKFDSGLYGNDFFGIGFGISGDALLKIDSHRHYDEKDKSDSTILNQENCSEGVCKEASGYSKFSEIYVKSQLGSDKKHRMIAEVGYGDFPAGMLKTFTADGSPVFPASLEGARLRGTWNNFSLSGVYVTGIKKNAQQEIHDLYADKKFEKKSPELDYVASAGVKQKLGAAKIGFDYATAESYKQRYALFGDYTLKLDDSAKLKLEAAYTENNYSGSKWDEHVAMDKNLFKDQDKTSVTSLRAQYIDGPLTLKTAFSTIGGNKAQFERFMSSVAGKPYQYATGYAEKWRRHGAKSYIFQTYYDMRKSDFEYLDNFTLDYKFVYGDTPNDKYTTDGKGNGIEHVFRVRYYLPFEDFKGARISGRLGKFYGDGTPDKTKMYLNLTLPIL